MTTIAYDGKILAADSLVTCQYNRVGHVFKIKTASGGKLPMDAVIGFAGVPNLSDCFIDSLKEGYPRGIDPQSLSKDAHYQALVIYRDGTVDEYDCSTPHPLNYSPTKQNQYAIGSGADYALGAMAVKSDAIEAVKVAIAYDVNSGGDICHFHTRDWKWTSRGGA